MFADDADYKWSLNYKDFSGNQAKLYEDAFTVDNANPEIFVSYDNNYAKNGKYFNADRTMTIEIREHNFNAADVVAKVTAQNARSEVANFAEYLKKPESWITYGNIHRATIKFTAEADYTFDIGYTDMSGRRNDAVNYGNSVAPTEFTLDKTAPTEADIKIDNKSIVAANGIAFEKFYNSAVTVRFYVNCGISGLNNIKYQKVNAVSSYSEGGKWVNYDSANGVVVTPSEKFVIYFRAEDNAGNVTVVSSTGVVVDNKAPEGMQNAPQIDISPSTANSNGLHNSNVTVDLKVVDPKYSGEFQNAGGYYSGLNKITYTIRTSDTDATESGVLLDVADNKISGAVYDSDNLISDWNGKITVDAEKFNSNNVIVEITAVDNSGNVRITSNEMINKSIRIDKTAPSINISYDNNTAYNGNYFAANRTATIVITERNFDPSDVKLSITNADGAVPKVSGWTKHSGSGNCDNTTWTATVAFNADGKYGFAIEYTDLAGNKCAAEKYAPGTVSPNEFVIDKTVPTVSVTYDNNSSRNKNYFKADRTATVVITEHNFDPKKVNITLKATDDGKAISAPTVNGWSNNGDKHTATIAYRADGYYKFNIVIKDKVENRSADFAEQTFYIDKTAPKLSITGVADNSANNGNVVPAVSYSDTNYDASSVSITLNGANRKSVALDGSYSEKHNGRTFTFKNFPKKKDVDDIYTLSASLTDKAGNSTKKSIVFSVNRFGSTYMIGGDTEKINGSYIKSPRDVVVTEVNPNKLKNIKITLYKNDETIVLREGVDYKVEVSGGNGAWYKYTYTIYSKNFGDDGVYRLSVHSEDIAGNIAENVLDVKDKEVMFGIDSTLPVINVKNLESKKTYATDNKTVEMSVTDNLKLATVIVELDGKEYKRWSDAQLEKIINDGGNFTFDIAGNSTLAHNLTVYAVDAAGNGEFVAGAELPKNAVQITNFFVTTNIWVRYYTNKWLFFGSIGGVIAVTGLIVILVVAKKRKRGKSA